MFKLNRTFLLCFALGCVTGYFLPLVVKKCKDKGKLKIHTNLKIGDPVLAMSNPSEKMSNPSEKDRRIMQLNIAFAKCMAKEMVKEINHPCCIHADTEKSKSTADSEE